VRLPCLPTNRVYLNIIYYRTRARSVGNRFNRNCRSRFFAWRSSPDVRRQWSSSLQQRDDDDDYNNTETTYGRSLDKKNYFTFARSVHRACSRVHVLRAKYTHTDNSRSERVTGIIGRTVFNETSKSAKSRIPSVSGDVQRRFYKERGGCVSKNLTGSRTETTRAGRVYEIRPK